MDSIRNRAAEVAGMLALTGVLPAVAIGLADAVAALLPGWACALVLVCLPLAACAAFWRALR